MINRYEKQVRIPVSQCDHNGKLKIPGMFEIFMDMASEHATDIGIGMDHLGEKGFIWLAVKSKLLIHSIPDMFSTVTAATWPAEPVKIRADRLYTMKQDGKLLAEAKNEWTVFEPSTNKLHRINEIYPEGFVHWDEKACEGSYAKLKDDFDDCQEIYRYKVASGDLDTSRHMNNVEYVKVIFNAFSSTQLGNMDVAEFDITYKKQCFENETLSVKIKEIENGLDIGVFKEDGTVGALARIMFRI